MTGLKLKTVMVILGLVMGSALWIPGSALGEKPRIAWFNTGSRSGFWPVVKDFITSASEDLGVDLRVHCCWVDPMGVVPSVEKVLSDPAGPPDAVMFHNFKNKGREILELCEKYKVPAFIFNAGFSAGNQAGLPREKYKQWIGLMLPDDEYAGYILAKQLISEAKAMDKRGKDGKIHVVALEGNRSSEPSNARVRGYKKALEAHKDDVVHRQFFHSKWWEELAFEAFELSMLRYPDVSLFWAASDSMAIGVIKAAEKNGWVPGRDYVTGGIDLIPRDQAYLESGKMAVSVGGHYAEGAWALVLLYDYLNGYDFGPFQSTVFSTRMGSHTRAGYAKIGDLREKLDAENMKKIDFRQFSRVYNPGMKKYNFEFKALFE